MTTLILCRMCHAKKLPECFLVKPTTGQRQKSCIPCREMQRSRPYAYSCNLCDRKFKEKGALQKHVKCVHDQTKDQKCPQCEAAFAVVGNLTAHVRAVHDGVKEFACTLCEFKTFANTRLKEHAKTIHEQVRDQHCSLCDYKCSQASTLRKHVQAVHEGRRDHHCEQCEAKFSSSPQLTAHIKSVHDRIKDQQCPTCDYKCSSNLRKHMKVCTGREHMSSGEYAIKGLLDSMGLSYIREMRFTDCRDIRSLPFDFYLPHLTSAIEFDGMQHFEPVELWGGAEALEAAQRRDAIKNAYCEANGIRLLRIKYTEFENIETLITAFIQVEDHSR